MKFWQVGFLIGLGILLGWLVWGRKQPPPAEPIIETQTVTVLRTDTVKFVPPEMIRRISTLNAMIARFLADTTFKPDTLCIRLLANAGFALDSLRLFIEKAKPDVTVNADTLIAFAYPVKKMWIGLRYSSAGDSAKVTWGDSLWYAPLIPKSKIAAVFTFGTGNEIYYGGQIRIDQSKTIQIQRGEKQWLVTGSWFLR